MAVTRFQDFDLADADRESDSNAAEKRVRRWAGAEDKPNEKYRDAHIWYDADNQDKFTAYKLLICDVVDEKLVAVLAAERASTSPARPAAAGLGLWSIRSRGFGPFDHEIAVVDQRGRGLDHAAIDRSAPALGYMQGCGCPPSRMRLPRWAADAVGES